MEQLWGLWSWMHKQYSRLVQVEARKRLESDQLESDNSHEHALKLINTECKHEYDIVHHEHKYRRGYVDFVSTTCVKHVPSQATRIVQKRIPPYHTTSQPF